MKKGFFCFVACLLSIIAMSQTVLHLDDYTMGQIDNAVTAEMNQSGIHGISIGVIYNGRVAYTRGYGTSLPGINITTATKFPIASISKTITGVMAMRMVDNGDLALNTTIDNYVPGYNNTTITIRHLLSHQSGIGHYDNCPGGYNGQFNAGTSLITVLGCSRCMSPPGSGTIYTTYGSTLLGVIIDIVGRDKYNKSYIQLYNEWIRDAAGLTNLTAEYNNSVSGLATGYDENGNVQFGNWSDIGWKLPAGGFISTAHDLADYGVGVMNYSFINSTRSSQMWTVQTTSGSPTNNCADGLDSPYGLAFAVSGGSSTNINLRINHSGLNDHGYSSQLYLYPNQKAGAVFLSNRYKRTNQLGDIMTSIKDDVLCPARRDFTSLINWTGAWIYESSDIINMTNGYTVAAANGSLVLDAAKEVVLKPGFYANSGTNFRAMIEGCGGTVKPY
jgi:CubicO group peptidase (beta-lactamase class C family)